MKKLFILMCFALCLASQNRVSACNTIAKNDTTKDEYLKWYVSKIKIENDYIAANLLNHHKKDSLLEIMAKYEPVYKKLLADGNLLTNSLPEELIDLFASLSMFKTKNAYLKNEQTNAYIRLKLSKMYGDNKQLTKDMQTEFMRQMQ